MASVNGLNGQVHESWFNHRPCVTLAQIALSCWTLLMAAISSCGCAASAAVVGSDETSAATVPAPARQAGYGVRTFGPKPTLIERSRRAPGEADLFSWQFVNEGSGGRVELNHDGSITLRGGGSAANADLASARSGSAPRTFEGIAFGGGGYFEAVLKFDGWQGQSRNEKSTAGGWPSFWSMAVEHLAQTGEDRVPGMPEGYENFIEMDFMEYNIEHDEHNDHVYSGSIINAYGIWAKTCSDKPSPQYCSIQNPYPTKIRQLRPDVDFSQYHAYGALWVPATQVSDGYIQWFFDDEPVGMKVPWKALSNPALMPPTPFGVGDHQHVVVILGTGERYPMTVRSVSVWQHSNAGNWIR